MLFAHDRRIAPRMSDMRNFARIQKNAPHCGGGVGLRALGNLLFT